MDPRDRADAMLARARARGRNIVTPDNMTSPMDSSDTLQIPRTLVNAVDPRLDPDSTMILTAAQASGQAPLHRPAQPQRPAQSPRPHQQAGPPPPMPTQPLPAQAADDAEITQVVQPGMIPTVSHHQTTRSSLSQRLSGDM
ncbi:hypothetical protein [Nocardia sp. NRRL S-836]|uniref:hypothetical protein n=1 Tax=Nocardia sp. NRRL S-836 TaxID=1519492 RepID=UPI0006AF5CD2|nr:hypothetical protein [Nocardia sp. NRRL S-836]KOV79872.1 hypothetical protein ADL03_35490 [Nocardia sp. NRRL S-836]